MDDCMDKRTAINLLDNLVGMVDDSQENDYDGALKMGIEALKADVQPVQTWHWIPCSERLPENSKTVLVTDWGITGFGRRYDGRWWDCDGNVLKDVSAWMTLPEPYEDGGGGID